MNARLKLGVVFAIFLGPLLAAFVWYYAYDGAFARRGGGNHAPLVTPPVTLTAFANLVVPAAGESVVVFGVDDMKRRWHIIHTLPAACGEVCARALYNTRQVRLALGRDAGRVRRVLIFHALPPSRLRAVHADAVHLLQDANGVDAQLAPLRHRHGGGEQDALLVDPLGNVMMLIPAALAPKLLLKDLKRLLRLSRIG